MNSDTTLAVELADITNADTVNVKSVKEEDEVIYLSIKSGASGDIDFQDGALKSEELDTTGVSIQTGLECEVRVDPILDPQSSSFEAEETGTSQPFDIALVEAENLDTGDQNIIYQDEIS